MNRLAKKDTNAKIMHKLAVGAVNQRTIRLLSRNINFVKFNFNH